ATGTVRCSSPPAVAWEFHTAIEFAAELRAHVGIGVVRPGWVCAVAAAVGRCGIAVWCDRVSIRRAGIAVAVCVAMIVMARRCRRQGWRRHGDGRVDRSCRKTALHGSTPVAPNPPTDGIPFGGRIARGADPIADY